VLTSNNARENVRTRFERPIGLTCTSTFPEARAGNSRSSKLKVARGGNQLAEEVPSNCRAIAHAQTFLISRKRPRHQSDTPRWVKVADAAETSNKPATQELVTETLSTIREVPRVTCAKRKEELKTYVGVRVAPLVGGTERRHRQDAFDLNRTRVGHLSTIAREAPKNFAKPAARETAPCTVSPWREPHAFSASESHRAE